MGEGIGGQKSASLHEGIIDKMNRECKSKALKMAMAKASPGAIREAL
jgi:hypothetical protein